MNKTGKSVSYFAELERIKEDLEGIERVVVSPSVGDLEKDYRVLYLVVRIKYLIEELEKAE